MRRATTFEFNCTLQGRILSMSRQRVVSTKSRPKQLKAQYLPPETIAVSTPMDLFFFHFVLRKKAVIGGIVMVNSIRLRHNGHDMEVS